MKHILFVLVFALVLPLVGHAQDALYQKGQFTFHWGWNRAQYTKSDIHFTGDNYDFTLDHVYAHDRQTEFQADIYFNPATITIPQTNFRLGYFITDRWQINVGVDHMKYIMSNNQTVNITGTIANSGTIYDNYYYDNQPIVLTEDFLTFEHTDGLNYVTIGATRFTKLGNLNTIWDGWNIEAYFKSGADIGFLYPKTNTKLLGKERHDDFHVSGYGLGADAGLHINFFKYVYLEGNLKGGFIHMPDIRTTQYESDKASQHFFFLQENICIGVTFTI